MGKPKTTKPREKTSSEKLNDLITEKAEVAIVEGVRNTPHGRRLALGVLIGQWADAYRESPSDIINVAGYALEDGNSHRLAGALFKLAKDIEAGSVSGKSDITIVV